LFRPRHDRDTTGPMAPPIPPPLRPSLPAVPRSARLLALWLGLGALAVVLAAMPSSLFDLDRFAAPKELALHLTALGAVILLGMGAERRGGLVAPELALLGFTLWSALSALLATNHWLAARALAITVSGAIIFHAARRTARQGAGGWLLAGLGGALVVAALTGLIQAYGFDFALLAESRAPGGTLGNRNFLAHLMAIGAPLLLLLVAESGGRRAAGLWAAGAGAMLAVLVLTRSRASWLAIGASLLTMLVAWLVARYGGREIVAPRRIRLAALALVIGAAAALLLPNGLDWRSDSPYRDTMRDLTNYRAGSGRGRLIQYRNSLRLMAIDPVFGTGPGNWPVKYPLVTARGDPSFAGADPMPTNPWPSSDWVAFLTERGLVAVVALLAALAAMGLSAARRLRRGDPASARRAIALLGVLTAALIAGAFDAVLLLAPPTLVVWAAAGVLVPETGETAPWRRRLPAGIAVVALFLACLRSLGQVKSIALAGPGWPVERLIRAVRYDPGSYRLNLMIAQRTGCATGRAYARAAARLFPHLPAPARRLRACGGQR
ncbi:MAG TPA: O-antigen ligase family protein, partial [Gemmatimonadales bacterium]